jgi:hypothetical protein
VFVELHLDDLVEAAIGGNSLIVRAGDLLDKIDDGSPQLCVRNLHEGCVHGAVRPRGNRAAVGVGP